jgi:hypothetical protein
MIKLWFQNGFHLLNIDNFYIFFYLIRWTVIIKQEMKTSTQAMEIKDNGWLWIVIGVSNMIVTRLICNDVWGVRWDDFQSKTNI